MFFNNFKIGSFLFICFLCLISSQENKKEKCDICNKIAKHFTEAMYSTSKSNFGGGNTDWEEKKLGKYLKSETRLLETIEKTCIGDKKFECNALLEELEELIEDWWETNHLSPNFDSLHNRLCVEVLQVCCPNGTQGLNCDDCPGTKINPCNGNGNCLNEGYKIETVAKCECFSGYQGDQCDNCSDRYFLNEENKNKIECLACHESCNNSCNSSSSSTCDQCKEGWKREANDLECKDIDECEDGGGNCSQNQFCQNLPGTFQCQECSIGCEGCSGPGNDKCVTCSPKYFLDQNLTCQPCHPSCNSSCSDSTPSSCDSCLLDNWFLDSQTNSCQDINECEAGTFNCSEEKFCENIPGSYKCTNCNPSCKTCSGPEKNQCTSCYHGYQLNDQSICIDINECETGNVCEGDNEICENQDGGFYCGCEEGYVKRGQTGKCHKKHIPKKNYLKKDDDESDGMERKGEEEIKKKEEKMNYDDIKTITPKPDGSFNEGDLEKLGQPKLGQPKENQEEQIVIGGKMEGKNRNEL